MYWFLVHRANGCTACCLADAPIVPEWSNIEHRPSLPQDTSSDHTFGTLSKWLHDCSQSHSRCYQDAISFLPERILEITATSIILRENAEVTRQATYACLSHCWGKDGPALQLTSDTMETLKSGVARAQLPRTFRDAVQICDRLAIQFLWIDTLCIEQDNLENWASTASVMADIYEGAYITIAATGSQDSSGGCFSQVSNRFSAVSLCATGLCARRTLPLFPQYAWSDKSTSDWPLLQRGWVFQERRLSTRIVHYAKEQIFWECESAFTSACGGQNWTVQRPYHNTATCNPMKYAVIPKRGWTDLVQMYSGLSFTKSSDRLPALGGIVKQELRNRRDDVYVAGMWKDTLLEDLGFSRTACYNNLPGIPSWSWACHAGPVNFTSDWCEPDSFAATELISIDVNSDGPSHMGKVVSASIRLMGPTTYIRAGKWISPPRDAFLDNGVDQLVIHDCDQIMHPNYYDELDPEAELLLILIYVKMNDSETGGKGSILVLQKLRTGVYQRLAHAKLFYARKDLQHKDGKMLAQWLVAENMRRCLALFRVQEVEII
ncbi:heterokaryon incompatibility protein-domain-containing protein [Paraphoma chrysanthemicola]|nr:heterokaryon incompatibility protein-domain-containing protein [Paraphoma chrysanthemicola]